MAQHTICEKVTCTGVGLHSGAPVQLTLHPARADSGIRFLRTDLPRPAEIPAHHSAIAGTQLATTLGGGAATVSTVEHLLSALHGLGVDNALAEVHGPELPVMDGSAAPFVYLIRSAGLYAQPRARRRLRLLRPLEVREGQSTLRATPAPEFRADYRIEFAHPAIGAQKLRGVRLEAESYAREISPARTFGFLRDVEALRRNGLAKGANLGNTLVLNDAGVINPEGPRFADEFVRHKVLDMFGDFALLGMPLQAHVQAVRCGHAMHLALVRKIAATPDAWEITEEAPPLSPLAAPAITAAAAAAAVAGKKRRALAQLQPAA